ncbi:MAG: hypothetical protein J1E02_00210 [Coprobacter sp.]|nr:hypothetical protein [Coprobacter sp.]
MWHTILLTAGFVALAFILLGVKVIFVKNGRFPDGHIASNEAMKKRGISCAKSMENEFPAGIRKSRKSM